ncbi:MAG: TlpA family protein disulfide reductase [Abditibacteriales bacterium]|nr:TlpA family protein disulfide reductase [Abditibacteriales bacterium]MDW8365370.1 TlpA disulfide reductase family protein [Abditibacteriales bacterium]
MTMRRQIGVLCGLVLVLGGRLEGGANHRRMPLDPEDVQPKITEGMKAVNFALPNLRGQRVMLSSFRGRPLVLAFFSVGGNVGQMLAQLQQLPEKYKDLKLSVLAVEISPIVPSLPQRVVEMVAQHHLTLPVLLDGSRVADTYGLTRRGAIYLLDDEQYVSVVADRPQKSSRLTEKLEFWAGNGSPTFGWREDILIGYEQALGERDPQGRPVPEDRRRPVPPQQAIRLLRSLIPPRHELAVQVDDAALDDSLVNAAKRTVEEAAKIWKAALPDLKITYVENRAEADVLLKFLPRVLNPQDPTGTQTLCIYCRALDEGATQGRRTSREASVKVLAQVAVEHGDGRRHGNAGMTHLVAAAFGYALGLDLCAAERGQGTRNRRDRNKRVDKTSIVCDNVDALPIALRPSADDLLILRNVHAVLHYQIGKLLIEAKRYEEARQEFGQIPPHSPWVAKAQEELKKIP